MERALGRRGLDPEVEAALVSVSCFTYQYLGMVSNLTAAKSATSYCYAPMWEIVPNSGSSISRLFSSS